jgi:hypothetical protein
LFLAKRALKFLSFITDAYVQIPNSLEHLGLQFVELVATKRSHAAFPHSYIPILGSDLSMSVSSRTAVKEAHHAEGLVIPKVLAKKRLLILDTPKQIDKSVLVPL